MGEKLLFLLFSIFFFKLSFFVGLKVFPELTQVGHAKLLSRVVLFPFHGENQVRGYWVLDGLDELLLLLVTWILLLNLVDHFLCIFLNLLEVLFILLLVQLLELNRDLLLFMRIHLLLLLDVVRLLDFHLLWLVVVDGLLRHGL